MTEQAKVPAIRFAGFTDPWEQRKLGDVTDSFSGGTPDGSHASYYGGSIPFIRSAEINSDKTELFLTEKGLDNSSAKIVERGTVLYALYGATSGEVGIAAIKGAINQAILALSPHTGNDPLFLASWLRREKARIVDTYLQGGQGNLSGSIVKELSFALPQQKEQQVIGSFFSHLDNLITLHQRKYDKLVVFKKSMLEKMFPKDGESVPEIRFAGFTDPWEQRKLEDIANRVTRKNEGESDLPLTISSQYGLVDQRTFFNNQVASKDMSGYYLLRKGEFAYNKSTSGDSPWGAVKRLVRYEKGCVSTLYICFGLDGADPDFLVTYYETDRWYKAVQMIAAEGARNHGLLNIAPNDFFDTALILPPSREEQELIGLFFARLDNLITLHQRKLELLRNIKKSLLDKMFV